MKILWSSGVPVVIDLSTLTLMHNSMFLLVVIWRFDLGLTHSNLPVHCTYLKHCAQHSQYRPTTYCCQLPACHKRDGATKRQTAAVEREGNGWRAVGVWACCGCGLREPPRSRPLDVHVALYVKPGRRSSPLMACPIGHGGSRLCLRSRRVSWRV